MIPPVLTLEVLAAMALAVWVSGVVFGYAVGVLVEMRREYPADHNDPDEIRRGRADRRADRR